jgi:hypothetical protein
MDERVKQIVEKLTEKSLKGGVIWKKISNKIFYINLPAGSIHIFEEAGSILNTYYEIDIYDSEGSHIYNKVAREQKNKECFKLLRGLYWNAVASYYNAGELYEKMLIEIKKADTIGREDEATN